MLEKLTPQRAFLLSAFIVVLALCVIAVDQWSQLIRAELPNPDSFYKLVLLREYTPETGFQYIARDNAPFGTYQHWSAVHSLTVLQFSLLLQAVGFAQNGALLAAGSATTVLSFLALALLVARVILNQGSPLAALVAVIALVSCGPLRGYGQPVQITHHVFMLVPVAAAAFFLFPTAAARRHWNTGAAIAGALLALALWISPETMLLVVAMVAIRVALRLQYPGNDPLWPIALGLCGTLLIGWLIDPPPPTFPAWALDHLSLAWLTFGGLLGGLLVLADLLTTLHWSLWRRVSGMTGAAIVAALSWLLMVPGALQGPAGLIPPELRTLWWNHIQELMPVTSASEAIIFVGMPLVAGLLLAFTAYRRRALWMAALALSTLVYGVLAAQHTRMGAAAGFLAMLSYGVTLAHLTAFREPRQLRGKPLASLGAVSLILLPSMQLLLAYVLLDERAVEMKKNNLSSRCKVTDIAPVLNALPEGTVLAHINDGPELLWRTPHRIIAGNYHHNVSGLLDYFHLWRSIAPDEHAQRLVAQRKIDYIIGCDLVPDMLMRNQGQPTLASRIAAGEAIDWLPVHETIGHWRLYRTHR